MLARSAVLVPMQLQIADLAGEDTPQLYASCGRGCRAGSAPHYVMLVAGARSSFRVLKHGLEVTEMAVTELPGNANAIWTVKRHISGASAVLGVPAFIAPQICSTRTSSCRSSTQRWC